ncbi:MAG: DUF2231 domain-containing protein [Vicinamibacterales bacterium]
MGSLHPQVVHFTIVLTFVGVALRLVSLFGRPAFASPAAATLLLLAALSGAVSARSGMDAHGPVERAPGARAAVVEHEEWGERAHNILIVIAVIELIGLVMRRSPHLRYVHMAAGVVGVVAMFAVYEAAEHGGELVYGYAGGVGIRSGEPKDVERLLLSGLYHQSQADRRAGRPQAAAELISLAARRFPQDAEVQLLAAESQLLDHRNAQAAIDALNVIRVSDENRALRIRRALLQADAFEAAGQKDAAAAVLQPIVEAFPANARVRDRLAALRAKP